MASRWYLNLGPSALKTNALPLDQLAGSRVLSRFNFIFKARPKYLSIKAVQLGNITNMMLRSEWFHFELNNVKIQITMVHVCNVLKAKWLTKSL